MESLAKLLIYDKEFSTWEEVVQKVNRVVERKAWSCLTQPLVKHFVRDQLMLLETIKMVSDGG